MPKSVLVIFAHPQKERSRVNRRILTAIKEEPQFTIRDLYDCYPDFLVDTSAEQEQLVQADLIAIIHPIYWYSVPSLLKEWQDAVWARGWAYAKDGDKLKGKHIRHFVSTGGPASSYDPLGYNQHPISQYLLPLQQSAKLCQMIWHEPLVFSGAHGAGEEEMVRHGAFVREELMSFHRHGKFLEPNPL
jgi:glutathione-regulated potassium-efflux system ancillary protein KefG